MVSIPPPPQPAPVNSSREIDAMLRQRDSALLCRELSLFPFHEQPQTVSVSVACPAVRLPRDSQYEAAHQGETDVLNKVPSGLLARTVVAHCAAIGVSWGWVCPFGIRFNYL